MIDIGTTALEVCEVFRSLQGETRYSGRVATFIRLVGCNLRCTYCDTRYAYQGGETTDVSALVNRIRAQPSGELVVVTGGEPLLQSAVPGLLTSLANQGRRVLLETNGSQDITGVDSRVIRIVDVKTPGSGEVAATRWDNLTALRASDEVKFVVTDRADFEFALEVIDNHELGARCHVLLSPVVAQLSGAELARWILERGGRLRLQLQLHRQLWPDRDRGV